MTQEKSDALTRTQAYEMATIVASLSVLCQQLKVRLTAESYADGSSYVVIVPVIPMTSILGSSGAFGEQMEIAHPWRVPFAIEWNDNANGYLIVDTEQ
jgi:hypothetical protein